MFPSKNMTYRTARFSQEDWIWMDGWMDGYFIFFRDKMTRLCGLWYSALGFRMEIDSWMYLGVYVRRCVGVYFSSPRDLGRRKNEE